MARLIIPISIVIIFFISCSTNQYQPTKQDSKYLSGKQIFIEYGCFACHTTELTDIPKPVAEVVSLKKFSWQTKQLPHAKLKELILDPWHVKIGNQTSELTNQYGEYGDVLSEAQISDLVIFIRSM